MNRFPYAIITGSILVTNFLMLILGPSYEEMLVAFCKANSAIMPWFTAVMLQATLPIAIVSLFLVSLMALRKLSPSNRETLLALSAAATLIHMVVFIFSIRLPLTKVFGQF